MPSSRCWKRFLSTRLRADRGRRRASRRFAAAVAWPRVVELYAGAGALGIEALSRGALWVDFIESKPAACRLIQSNLATTGLAERAAVRAMAAEQAATALQGRYDLVLADPPYADTEAVRVLDRFMGSERVDQHTVLVWEHHHATSPSSQLGLLSLRRTIRHGVAALSLYTGAADQAPGRPGLPQTTSPNLPSQQPAQQPDGVAHEPHSAGRRADRGLPGAFDPVHLGHFDIARRASAIFDRLIVAVFDRPNKPADL